MALQLKTYCHIVYNQLATCIHSYGLRSAVCHESDDLAGISPGGTWWLKVVGLAAIRR